MIRRAGWASLFVVFALAVGVALVWWLQRAQPTYSNLPAPRFIDLGSVAEPLRDLAESCNALPESDHPILSLRPLEDALDRLARARDEGGDIPPGLYLAVAQEMGEAGDVDGALEYIDHAAAVMPPEDERGTMVIHYARASAHLRAASRDNCTSDGDPGACLLKGAERYAETMHAQQAIISIEALLTVRPGDLPARWLLNIAHARRGTYPEGVPSELLIPPEAFGAGEDAPLFVDVARDRGVAAANLLGGSIMDDFDNDGFLDIFTTTYDPCGNVIVYHNNGDGTFTDRTVEAGLSGQLGGFNAVQTDYDNDGFLDVLILRGAWQGPYGRRRNSLLRNKGDGTFVDVTKNANLDYPAYPTQAGAWADYDNDGDLDLYVGNEAASQDFHYPSQLFRNNGDGTFSNVNRAAGVMNDRMAKGVAWGDYDNDGDPDLYVSNIGPNRLYRNNGDGTFTDVAPDLGLDEPSDRSFVPWFWDFDNDGWLDLYVAGYSATLAQIAADYMGRPARGARPKLFRNDQAGGFEDVTVAVGLAELQLPMGANFGDIDNDGWLDIYLATGSPPLEMILPNVMYRNVGGTAFVDVTLAAGVGHLEKGHGVAFGDIDNDGDQDIYVQMGGFSPIDYAPNALFANTGNANHWITVRLIGHTTNRVAIGARVRLTVNDGGTRRRIYGTVSSGGSFGASSLQLEMGVGKATVVEELEVWWPTSGTRQVFRDVAVDQIIGIEEGVDVIVQFGDRTVNSR
ncbi:MAG: CRTAC1 family protein [Gemmatimonadales bacterium]